MSEVDFDEYVDPYEKLLKEQLSFFSPDRNYFSAYKVELGAKLFSSSPRKILDFGCGVGLSLPHFRRCYPQAELYATDISKKSLEYVRSKYPDVYVLKNWELREARFDLIFLAGVLHHVPIDQRVALMKRLCRLVVSGGTLCVFEHNPFNPITRKMVATCPFDEGVNLISMRRLLQMVQSRTNMVLEKKGYCLFFPEVLRRLRTCETFLRWLPLGGQYFVMARAR